MSVLATTAQTGDSPGLSVTQVRQQVQHIQQLMAESMKDGEHYGKVPGCGDKPTLLQPGAEKIALLFGFAATYDIKVDSSPDGHREYAIVCKLVSRSTGQPVGEGVGVCSTRESKYRYRGGERKCPACGKPTIIKGKAEYGGGWVCFAKKGGCGAKWGDGATEIESQQVGRVDNPDIADMYNTVLKMGKKRAFVDAVRTATAASDVFAQDLEDLPIAHEPAQVQPAQAQPTETRPPARRVENESQPQGQLDNPCIATVTGVTEGKKGTGAKGPWTLYKVATNVGTFDTFSLSHANACSGQVGVPDGVRITWAEGKYGNEMKSVQTKPAPREQPAVIQEDEIPF